MSTPSVHLAVLVVATDPAKADLATAMIIRGRATSAGHQIVQQHVTKDMEAGIRAQLARWIDDKNIDVILVTGAVESDAVSSAIKPLITQQLEGFKDLFRYLAFQEMGAGAMLSNAEAAQCNTTFLFVMPGAAGAVGTAMDKLILPQLDPKTQPKNLVSQIPRLKNAPKEEGVPSAISPEKTTGGLGVQPKLPASPIAARGKAPTGKNVIRRAAEDPPTKQIELAKLERLSNPNEAQTKPAIDLRKLLPKVPPGADENLDDPDTDLELLAAPPPPLSGVASEKHRIDTSPPIPPPKPLPSALPSIKGNAFQSKEGTQPGTPVPTKSPAASGAIPKVTDQQRSAMNSIERDAFKSKDATQPGTPVPTRNKPLTGPRPRPISVPPTNVFSDKPGSAGASANRAAAAATPAFGTANRSAATATPAGGTATTSASNPTASGSIGSSAATPAMGMRTTGSGGTQRPISSASITPPSSSIFAAAAEEAKEIKKAKELREQREVREAKAAAERAAATPQANGTSRPAFHSSTPSVEMAPLVEDAALIEDDAPPVAPARPAREPTAPPPPPAARKRELTPPPVTTVKLEAPVSAGAAESAPSSTIDADARPPVGDVESVARKRQPTPPPVRTVDADAVARKRQPTPPPVRTVDAPSVARNREPTPPTVSATSRASGELPVGTFNYPAKKRRGNRAFTILLLLFALGAGFGAVVYFGPKLMHKTDEGAKVATNDHPTPPPTPVEPAAGSGSSLDVADGSQTNPDTTPDTTKPNTTTPDTTKPDTTKPNTTKPNTTKPNTAKPNSIKADTTKPDTTKPDATKPDATKPDTTKPDTTKPDTTKPDDTVETKPMPTGDPECDETSCVLSKYDRPCCERYRPTESDIKPRAGNIPEELDRSMVRAGMEKVKPAVVKCGEKAGVKGQVKIAVTVAPEGNVTAAEATESPDPGLGTCVAAAIKKAQFGKSVNGGSFTYPFVF